MRKLFNSDTLKSFKTVNVAVICVEFSLRCRELDAAVNHVTLSVYYQMIKVSQATRTFVKSLEYLAIHRKQFFSIVPVLLPTFFYSYL